MSIYDLTASGYVVDDCILIKSAVEISKLIMDADHNDSIIVPPSNFSTNNRDSLECGLKAELMVKIGKSKRLNVNTCVLSSRSPLFHEQLCMCDSMIENSICIEDVDVKVFEVPHYMDL